MSQCFTYTADFCSSRFGAPLSQKFGRGGKEVKYIVLHQLSKKAEDFRNDVQTSIPFSQKYTTDPRSLHYLVNEYGAVNSFIKESDTAWGINGINSPTINLFGETENTIDRICLHVGVESGGWTNLSENVLAKIICCSLQKYELEIEAVILSYNINEAQDNLSVIPYALLQKIKTCEDGNFTPPVPIPLLPTCCETLIKTVADLEAKVLTLSSEINTQNEQYLQLKSEIAAVVGLNSQYNNNFILINGQFSEITRRMTALETCTDCVDECKEKNCQKIHYRSTSVNAKQHITPNQPVRINFNTKVSDNTPPIVTVGPLWNAVLSCPCNTKITVNLRIKGASYCPNKKIWVDLISECSGSIRLGEVSPTNTNPLSLSGSAFILNPVGCNVYLEIGTNDLEPKLLEFSEILIECG